MKFWWVVLQWAMHDLVSR